MRLSSAISSTIATALTVLNFTACDDAPSAVSHESLHDASQVRAVAARSSSLSPSTAELVRKLHAASARYHSTQQATAAGYEVSSPCVAEPGLGGMGFHWVNGGLVDPAFDPMQPEALVYAPNAEGKLKLVAVEYIVIAEAWHAANEAPPVLMGQHFHLVGSPNRYGLPPFYELHVWAGKENPNGTFADWHAHVTCDGAGGR